MTAYVTENPATGDVEQTFATMSDDDVNDVLARSAAAYQEWRHTAVEDRVAMLRATAQAYRDRADELAALISKEMGKPLAQAHGELALTAMIYDWYAENGPAQLETEQLAPQGAAESTVTREPIGPLLGIMPWNFPYYQVARFAAPNLLLGKVVVVVGLTIAATVAVLIGDIASNLIKAMVFKRALTFSLTGAQIAGMAEGGGAFEHDFPATRYTIEISRLAPQLSTRQQKLALELIRDMAERKEQDED